MRFGYILTYITAIFFLVKLQIPIVFVIFYVSKSITLNFYWYAFNNYIKAIKADITNQ